MIVSCLHVPYITTRQAYINLPSTKSGLVAAAKEHWCLKKTIVIVGGMFLLHKQVSFLSWEIKGAYQAEDLLVLRRAFLSRAIWIFKCTL